VQHELQPHKYLLSVCFFSFIFHWFHFFIFHTISRKFQFRDVDQDLSRVLRACATNPRATSDG
jgi:hypothetical protein